MSDDRRPCPFPELRSIAPNDPRVRRLRMLALLRDPDRWPMFPRMPLVRRHQHDGADLPFPDVGFLGEASLRLPGPLIVFVGDVLEHDAGKLRPEPFDSLEAILDAGWEVD